MKWILCLLFCSLLVLPSSARSQDSARTRVHGYTFGDYFYKVSGSTAGSGQYAGFGKDDQAFQLRRIYLFVDHAINSTFATQVLIEGNDKAFDPGGRHGLFFKTAYLQWKNIFRGSNLFVGMIPTPTWSFTENLWFYRSVEKTVTDFRGFGAATDLGIGLKGRVSEQGAVNYQLMIGNGTGQRAENNRQKKIYGSLSGRIAGSFVAEVYSDYEAAANDKAVTTMRALVGYQNQTITVAAEVIGQRQNHAAPTGDDRLPLGVSLFCRASFPGTSALNGFLRLDSFDPDTKLSTDGTRERFIVVGVDYSPSTNIHLMPNVWINTYASKSNVPAPDTDVLARLTALFGFD